MHVLALSWHGAGHSKRGLPTCQWLQLALLQMLHASSAQCIALKRAPALLLVVLQEQGVLVLGVRRGATVLGQDTRDDVQGLRLSIRRQF
jgi:hypothetical protein